MSGEHFCFLITRGRVVLGGVEKLENLDWGPEGIPRSEASQVGNRVSCRWGLTPLQALTAVM